MILTPSQSRFASCVLMLLVAVLALPSRAEPVAVRFPEGTLRAFLSLQTLDGQLIAAGDLTQTVQRSRLKSHVVFRFRDGSLDDETAIFTQRGSFRLVSDHHIQSGASFPHQTDVAIDTVTQQVVVRYHEKGETKVARQHKPLPADLVNGIIVNVLKNIPPSAKEVSVSFLAADPKPRLVKLCISAGGAERFTVAGYPASARRLQIKIAIGGVSGVMAPLVGKKPQDLQAWILGGDAPALLKYEGPLYLGGPIWRTQMASPVWSDAAKTNVKDEPK